MVILIMNFNIIVLITTLVFYIYLRSQNTNNVNDKNKSGNFMYLLCVPIGLYIGKYIYDLYNTSKNIISEVNTENIENVGSVDDLLTTPYPMSTSN